MFNRVDSRLHGLDDGSSPMGVSRYFLSVAMSFLYDGDHFLGRELDVVGQISLPRIPTSAGAELHPVSTVFQDLAHLFLHCRDAVGNAFVSIVKLGSEVRVVAMAAGAANHRSGDLHARAGNISGVDAIAQRNIGVMDEPTLRTAVKPTSSVIRAPFAPMIAIRGADRVWKATP